MVEATPPDTGGLRGEYYDNKDLTALTLTRTDPTVNFSWGPASPDPSLGAESFSVRWTGSIKADHSQTYTFYTTSNDGVRLWVNGQRIINNWTDHGATEDRGTITLQAGQWYPIKLEYYESSGSSIINLSYSSASTAKQVIPSDHLSPQSNDTIVPTITSVAPADGATDAAISANVVAAFSEAMDATTINPSTFTLAKQGTTTSIPATVSYDSVNDKAVLNPDVELEVGATYTAMVSRGAKDQAGNALAEDKVWSFATSSTTGGLTGEYYDNKDFTALKLTRTDLTVNFSWGSGSPDPSIAAESFSVRWTGSVKADHSQTYTFYTTSNDGVRLWVGDKLVINNWTDHGAVEDSGTISLQANQWYPIKLEYYEGSGSSVIKLSYSSASTAKQVIPSDHLSPAAP